jgi:gamma-glutamyltranspeptidase/glutathione hydrolase
MGPFCSSELRRSKESAAVLWEKMRKLGGLRLLDALYLHQHINHGHSDALVAVDQEGNVAALCHSINTATWGATGIFVDGVSIPDSGCFQQWQIRQAGRGARLPDAMNPVIVLKSGRPILAASCTGIGLHETALQHLIDVLIFGMHPEAAVDRPHFMGPVWPKLLQSAGGTGRLARLGESCFWLFASMALRLFPEARSRLNVGQAIEDEGFADDVLESLRKMGQPVRLVPRNLPLGYWAGVRIDADSGALAGAVTPRPRDSGASAVGCD